MLSMFYSFDYSVTTKKKKKSKSIFRKTFRQMYTSTVIFRCIFFFLLLLYLTVYHTWFSQLFFSSSALFQLTELSESSRKFWKKYFVFNLMPFLLFFFILERNVKSNTSVFIFCTLMSSKSIYKLKRWLKGV